MGFLCPEALVSLQVLGKDHFGKIIRGQLHAEGLLGVVLLIELVRMDLRSLCLQCAGETLDLEVLVLGLQGELRRCCGPLRIWRDHNPASQEDLGKC